MINEIKECKKHGLTNFASVENATRFRCRKCQSDAVQKRREILKQKAIEYKGGKCICCEYNKCVSALEFHHIDPSKKDFNLGSKGKTRSWEKIKIELDKCVLLCANCHREVHSGMIELK